jgi:phage terminase large subunit
VSWFPTANRKLTRGAERSFYADEMRAMLAEGRITHLEINKDVRVHTAWDLGLSDSTAIWFVQCVGRERRLVDYYEASGVGLDHYVQVLNETRIAGGYMRL